MERAAPIPRKGAAAPNITAVLALQGTRRMRREAMKRSLIVGRILVPERAGTLQPAEATRFIKALPGRPKRRVNLSPRKERTIL